LSTRFIVSDGLCPAVPGGRPAERRGTIAAIFLAARCDFDNKNGAAPLPAGF
jgi:hypothetical protein